MAILKVANVHHDASGFTRTQVSTANTYTVHTAGSERLRVTSDGLVGIGATSPSGKLHVAGTTDARVSHFVTNANTAGFADIWVAANSALHYTQLYVPGTAASALNFGSSFGGGVATLANASLQFSTFQTPRMAITGRGLVGIGTTAPAANLHVVGDTYVTGNVIFDVLRTTRILSPATNTMTFVTANTEQVRITSAGDVGIGTNDPYGKFHVAGSSASGISHYVSNIHPQGYADIWVSANNYLHYAQLIVPGTSASALNFASPFGGRVAVTGNSSLRLSTFQVDRMTITERGLVGINITNPTANLHVVGTATITGALNLQGADVTTAIASKVSNVLGTAGRITSTGGTTPNIDLATAGAGAATYSTGISAITVDDYGRVTSVTGSAGYVTSSGSITGSAGTFTSTTQNSRFNSLGIGSALASGTAGEIRASGNITAYYSDRRLKDNIVEIDNALNKLCALSGVTFTSNEEAAKYGYTDKRSQVGVIAQEVEAVLPQIVVPAPFDIGKNEDGTEYSISGENYKTVQYEKMVPLLIEAIKELKREIDELKVNIINGN